MRRSRSSLCAALAACGPPQVFHKEAERTCATEVVLAAREDVARIAGCTEMAGIAIKTAGALDLGPLARLETIRGDLVVGPSVGFEELALPRLREVTGAVRVVGNGNLHAVTLPRLERAGRIEIDGNNAVANITLPRLAATAALVITGDPELELVDVSALAAVPELVIADNPKLVSVDGAPRAARARIENNHQLPAERAGQLRQPP